MPSNNTTLADILALLPDNTTNEISADDMRISFSSTFGDREVAVIKLETKGDLGLFNANIYEGSLVVVWNDLIGTDNGIYLSLVNQPTDFNNITRLGKTTDIIDNLVSVSTVAGLSANMGRDLDERIVINDGNITTNTTNIANKLDLSGGILTGNLTLNNFPTEPTRIVFTRDDNSITSMIYSSDTTGQAVFARYANDGLTIESQLILGTDGVSISGPGGSAPVIEDALDLVTKDYVDNIPINVTASDVTYDPTNDPTTSSVNIQAAVLDHGQSIEQRVSKSTGVFTGGVLSPDIGANTFQISAGSGVIVDNYTTPDNSSFIDVTWLDLTAITITMDPSGMGYTSILMDNTGAILQVIGAVSPAQIRQNIGLGVIYYENNEVDDIVNAPKVFGMTATDVNDLMNQEREVTGFQVLPLDNSLQIYIGVGQIFGAGINWINDRTNPNNVSIPQSGDATIAITFTYYDRNLTNRTVTSTIPQVADLNGTITPLPGNDACIHRLYLNGIDNPQPILLLGQTIYNSARVAKDNLLIDDNTVIIPEPFKKMKFIGWICVNAQVSDFTNINDAWIVSSLVASSNTVTALTNHNDLVGRDAIDQHIIEAITGLREELDATMKFFGPWIDQIFQPNWVVTDEGWTMISNTVTTERASPQKIGSIYGDYENEVFTNTSEVAILSMDHVYTFSQDGYISGVDIYTPFWAFGVYTKVTITNLTDDTTIVIKEPRLVSNSWENIFVSNIIVRAGNQIKVELDYHNTTATPVIEDTWNIQTNSTGVPIAGECSLDDQDNPTQIIFDYTSEGGNDMTAALQGIVAGDNIRFVQDTNAARNMILEVVTIDITDPTSILYGVLLIDRSVDDIRDDKIMNFTFTSEVSAPSEYSYIADYYTANQPTFATVTTDLRLDGVVQPASNDGYGINLFFQAAYVSSEWDVLASK